jgi:dTMP kinase
MKRGLFIAVEGIDGSGSTTQAKLLGEYLESLGRKTYLTAEPSSGPLGKAIRGFLRDRQDHSKLLAPSLALSFAADRLFHFETEIQPQLAQGVDVISDRYVLSSLVYQGLDLPQAWVKEVNAYAPVPDVTILIDAPEVVAKERREKRGGVEEIFDKSELQIRLRERYLSLAPSVHAIVVDGSSDVNNVRQRMIEAVRVTLEKI